MDYEFRKLSFDRYLVWDLLRDTDPFYLNHHLFDTDFSAVVADCDARVKAGKLLPSFLAYAIWAYSRTLTEFPELNSFLRMYPTKRLAIYNGVDVSMPIERQWAGRNIVLLSIVRNAQSLSIDEINDFICTRRDSPLEDLEEFQGYRRLLRIPSFLRWPLLQIFLKPFPKLMRQSFGTTAFTSVGKFGSTATTPLSPRTCCLSLGKVEPRPRSLPNGEVVTRPSAWLTVTYDHRIADGATVARFGNRMKAQLETTTKF